MFSIMFFFNNQLIYIFQLEKQPQSKDVLFPLCAKTAKTLDLYLDKSSEKA